MEALDEVKDKMPENNYLTLCNALKEQYDGLINGENTIYNGIQQSITIPSSFTTIPSLFFRGSPSLTSVTFTTPSSVTSIGDSAFRECSSLTSITIPPLSLIHI